MSGQSSCQINCSRTFGAIETPNGFGDLCIVVDGFAAIAPTGRHSDGKSHTLATELLGTSRCFVHTTDSGIGYHALHRRTVAVFKRGADKVCQISSHVHGLRFERFTHTALTAIDGWANADFWILTLQATQFWLAVLSCRSLIY